MTDLIKLLIPKMPKAETLLPYLKRIDNSRWYTNFGGLERELRDRLEKKYGAYVVTVSSCTSGLELMYRWLNGAISTIGLPSLTFYATAMAAAREGLRIKYEDVNLHTWTHPAVAGFGVPVQGRWVDAAAAFGEQKVAPNQMAVFSMHATKMLGAGEGGYIVTHDRSLADLLRQQTNFGIYAEDNPDKVSTIWGTNAKLSEYHAAVALAAFDAFDRDAWVQLDLWYRKYLPSCVIQQLRPIGTYPVLAVRLPSECDPSIVKSEMLKLGIETRRWYWPPLHEHTMIRLEGVLNLPVTEMLSNSLLGLPWHLFLTEEDVIRVCSVLTTVIKEGSYELHAL